MTDNEIIKALEYCKDCSANLNVEIIDLINRQQAEIERLRKEVNLVSIQFQDLQERYEEAQIIAQRKGVITMQNDMTDKQRKEDEGK